MTKTLSYSSILLALIFAIPAMAQEMLTGTGTNQAVKEMYELQPSLKSSGADTLELPFFDDFSGSVVYPDIRKWSDRYAFINNDHPVNPRSYGVATLDAIDHTGQLYPHATIWPFVADHLTSLPVNLDYPESDSIYLSFFYQPQGKGDQPQTGDSLRLEFYSPVTGTWKTTWSVPGTSVHEFKLVMIPVTDTAYLQNGFRFRFSNLASIADNRGNPGSMGNGDHWHIDYVLLDRGRSHSDTIFRDVALIKSPGSLLNNYESMPWDHFQIGRLAEMGSVVPFAYRNNGDQAKDIGRRFTVSDVYENRTVHTYPGSTSGIGPGQIEYHNSDLAYSFSSGQADSALFRITTWIETDLSDFKGNDTVKYYQKFGNYFAYDDGTAENGYGLHGGGTENAKIAYRFRAYKADSLRAIRIYFNRSLNDASRQYFRLAVWDDDNGRPGNLVYFQEGQRPEYEDQLNRFHTYELDSPVYVNQVFYVGIIQNTTAFLNIGFDVNRNNRTRIFYNIYGNWQNSSFEGSLMIRPVVGASPLPTYSWIPEKGDAVRIYPNPASDILYIEVADLSASSGVIHSLYNLQGQLVYQAPPNTPSIDLTPFPPGIYILQSRSRGINLGTNRILISR